MFKQVRLSNLHLIDNIMLPPTFLRIISQGFNFFFITGPEVETQQFCCRRRERLMVQDKH